MGVSFKRFETVFSKELKKRERSAGGHEVSSKALECTHDWDSTGAGGVVCQVCNFETKDRSYCCSQDCGVKLCGSCWWKWKEKLQLASCLRQHHYVYSTIVDSGLEK